MHPDTAKYNKSLALVEQEICDLLAEQIDRNLPEAKNKIWHAHPVWFLDGNPVVGYGKLKSCVRLLFWSGQSFEEEGLKDEGSFKAAEVRYTAADQVDLKALQRWMAKARDIQWDYKNIVRRKGKLVRLKSTEQRLSKTSRESTKDAKKAAAKRVDATAAKRRNAAPKSQSRKAAKPKLLSGGNPQIAKGDGDAPVRAYIAAMPGWKRDVGRRLDALIVRTVPDVRKAVRWNSPFYGIEGQGWFLSFHCITKYVKVAFFNGMSLRPVPPVESKNVGTRYFHIHENDQLDEKLVASWIRQASKLPGEHCF